MTVIKEYNAGTGTWVPVVSGVQGPTGPQGPVGYGVETGMVQMYAASTAPAGWLLCDGSAVSRTTYSALFAVVGLSFGAGDGSTTFNVPDLRGRVVAGLDNMGGNDAGRLDWGNAIGTSGGSQTHTLTTAEMPSHTHTQDSHNHTQNAHTHAQNAFGVAPTAGGYPTANGFVVGGAGTDQQGGGRGNANATATNIATTATNQNTGGGGAHNNMQPTLLMSYIIKY